MDCIFVDLSQSAEQFSDFVLLNHDGDLVPNAMLLTRSQQYIESLLTAIGVLSTKLFLEPQVLLSSTLNNISRFFYEDFIANGVLQERQNEIKNLFGEYRRNSDKIVHCNRVRGVQIGADAGNIQSEDRSDDTQSTSLLTVDVETVRQQAVQALRVSSQGNIPPNSIDVDPSHWHVHPENGENNRRGMGKIYLLIKNPQS
jgi:hypothetical protein